LSSRRTKRSVTRGGLLETLAQLGREHSDATVLFHATMARLLDLNVTDYKTMSVLQRLGPMSAGEIAQHTGLATASVTNLVDRLEKKGYVRRVHDPADRRRVMVEPVETQAAEAHRHFSSARQSLARFYDKYRDDELAVIADFLARNAERLRAETKKLDPDR
jgi:DNA-binding MarR family transcriptional regulator